MVRRPKKKMKKTAHRKTVSKKKVARKKSPSKKRAAKKVIYKKIPETSISNQESQWKIYKNLQQRIDKAWDQLQKDVESNAPENILLRNKNHLLLLLGECNYLARECVKSAETNQ